jgi:hypothetical protein
MKHIFSLFFLALGVFLVSLSARAANDGKIEVSWTAPTTNTDGSAYTNPDGYYLYYSTSATIDAACAAPCVKVNITAETTLTYTLTNIAPGTYYVTVAVYNKNGNQSALPTPLQAIVTKLQLPGPVLNLKLLASPST